MLWISHSFNTMHDYIIITKYFSATNMRQNHP